MDAKEYRMYHENHLSANRGTSFQECLILVLVVPFCTFLSSFFCSSKSKIVTYLSEFIIIILPTVLNCTLLSNINQIIFINFVCLCAIIFFIKVDTDILSNTLNFEVWDSRSSITNYRSTTNFFSALCILAVDFTVFPKRLAKTESFGFGLMDLGVGFFIFSNGIVSKQVSVGHLPKLLRNVLVLFLLGLMRVVSVKSINYQEQVAEYGVHWNFFFTLALCQLVSYFIMISTNNMNPKWLALLTVTVHQLLLYFGLQEWVLSDSPRISFLSANREGLTSCLGYVSIYFSASAVKQCIFKPDKTYKKILINLITLTGITWIGFVISFKFFYVSRRLINIGYIFWLLSLSFTGFTLFVIGELVLISVIIKTSLVKFIPSIFESINANGLFFFLFANLLTGVVNMTFQTLLLGNFLSLIIILSYMFVLCFVTCFMFEKRIFLKL